MKVTISAGLLLRLGRGIYPNAINLYPPKSSTVVYREPMQRSVSFSTVEAMERATLLNPRRSLMDDRLHELAEYLDLPPEQVTDIYRSHYVDRTVKPPRFDGTSLVTILASYTNPAVLNAHFTKLMLHYTRYTMAFSLVSFFDSVFSPSVRERVRVVDYGCGAADFGLAFGLSGYRVILVDIEGGKIEFASWRFRRRNLPFDVIGINEAREYADLAHVDIVIAGDLLEHLRDPRKAIRAVHAGLASRGYFWFPDFPFKEKSVGGDHLPEAAALRLEAADLVNELFERAGKVKHIMRKRT